VALDLVTPSRREKGFRLLLKWRGAVRLVYA